MNFATDRHGDLSRALIPSGRGALTRRCRARRVRGDSVSDRPSVRLACGSAGDPSWRRHAPSGLEIVPGGDETSALLRISPASAGGRARNAVLTIDGPRPEVISPASAGGRARQILATDMPRPEVISQPITRRAWNAEIVSKGRPQAVYNANRIARANKLGAAMVHARLRTCDAASSACNIWDSAWRSRGAKFANLHAVGRCCSTFRRVFRSAAKVAWTSKLVSTASPRPLWPVDLPCASTVRSPWAGSEKRPGYFSGEDTP